MDKTKKIEVSPESLEAIFIAPPVGIVPDVALRLDPVSKSPVRQPSIGEIVLFRISADGESLIRSPKKPPVYRPFLILQVYLESSFGHIIDGELFLNVDTDWAFSWVKENFFVQLSEANRIRQVTGVKPGRAMGQWIPVGS